MVKQISTPRRTSLKLKQGKTCQKTFFDPEYKNKKKGLIRL